MPAPPSVLASQLGKATSNSLPDLMSSEGTTTVEQDQHSQHYNHHHHHHHHHTQVLVVLLRLVMHALVDVRATSAANSARKGCYSGA